MRKCIETCASPAVGIQYPQKAEDLFRHEVFKLLRAEGKINDAIIENMLNWPPARRAYASESVTVGSMFIAAMHIWPHNEEGLENLARTIIRASFSQERMTYIPAYESNAGIAKVLYESKDGKTSKTFDALDGPRQRTAGCKHLLSLLRTSRTRANRWFVTMAFTQINRGGLGKKQERMAKCRP